MEPVKLELQQEQMVCDLLNTMTGFNLVVNDVEIKVVDTLINDDKLKICTLHIISAYDTENIIVCTYTVSPTMFSLFITGMHGDVAL